MYPVTFCMDELSEKRTMKGSTNIIGLRGPGTPPSTVEGSPPPLVIDHHRLSRDKASKALLGQCICFGHVFSPKIRFCLIFSTVLLIHGHGVEDLRVAAHMISQGANVNYVLEEGEELPCHCSKCRDVVRPVSSAFIVRDRAPLEFWRLNTIGNRVLLSPFFCFHMSLSFFKLTHAFMRLSWCVAP